MPIPLIVMGVAAVASAKIKSNAAKKAAEAQQKGTDQALGIQQKANAPYMDLGQQAAQRLQQSQFQPYTQSFQGRPMPGQSAPQGPPPGFQAFQPPPTLGSIGQPPPGMPGSPDQQRAMMEGVRAGQPQGQPGMGQPPQGGMVTLQAPTGETVRMPDGPMVQQAMSRGARRVG